MSNLLPSWADRPAAGGHAGSHDAPDRPGAAAQPAARTESGGAPSPRRLIRTPANLALAGLSAGIGAFQLFIVPLWLLPASGMWLWPLAASICLAPFQWAVIHEAIHGLLLPSRRGSEAAGRLLCIAFGVPFHLLRFGHLMHHRYNRCAIDRPEVYDPRRRTWLGAAPGYYAYLLGGMYLRSAAAGLLTLLPRPWVRWMIARTLGGGDAEVRQIGRLAIDQIAHRHLAESRFDMWMIVAVHAAAAAAYGAHLAVALAAYYGRGLLVSLHDNVYHYGTPLSARMDAKNLSLPGWCRGLFLHVNLHRVHHRFPYVPWHALPAWAPAEGVADAAFLHGLAAQFRGPIPVPGAEDALPPESGTGREPAARADAVPMGRT